MAEVSKPPRGVLRPQASRGRWALSRREPSPALAPFVEFHWIVRWDLEGAPPYEQEVLSHPNLHLVFEEPQATVYGVDRGLFVRRLAGRGKVLGVKFTVGGFRPFLGRPVAELVDRTVPAAQLFGPEVDALSAEILALAGDAEMTARAERWLLARRPEPDPGAAHAAEIVEAITEDRSLLRVDQVARRFGLSVRALQRLFTEYVGAPPKWVLRRARLHEAAERAARSCVDWPALAADLGYADQSHLVRDFTATVGVPPTVYALRG